MADSYALLKEQVKSQGLIHGLVSLHMLHDQLNLPKKNILRQIVDFQEQIPIFVSYRTFGSQLVEDLYVTNEDARKVFLELTVSNN